ncbi:MAG: hypothetical protein B7733_10430 [Myxococcales bacterium FL481]|nr:MAG: hypothetical protein B7733_10430 [Myxococcales bacterium FL481]
MPNLLMFALLASPGGCSPSDCGSNSPIIGHELHETGATANDAGVKIVHVTHRDYPTTEIKIDVVGDELIGRVPAVDPETAQGERELRGNELIGLTLELRDEHKRTYLVELKATNTLKLWHNDVFSVGDGVSVCPWESTSAVQSVVRSDTFTEPSRAANFVPSYLFEYTMTDSSAMDVPGRFTLCPLPSEDTYVFPYTSETTVDSDRACPGLNSSVTDYHAVLFSGERYDSNNKTLLPSQRDDYEWFNIACKGDALFKLHLSGHTDAAVDRYAGPEQPGGGAPPRSHAAAGLDRAHKQAMLYAITGQYCGSRSQPENEAFTVPGQALRFDTFFPHQTSVVAPYGFASTPGFPETLGEYEAIWDDHGAVCLNVPRRTDAEPDIRKRIVDACGTHTPPACTRDQLGSFASDTRAVVTYTPGTCMIVENGPSSRCGPPDARIGCHCDERCTAFGDCCFDYEVFRAQCGEI